MKKRGMSAVVQTLLIVLLAIVLIGIVWVVIRNVVMSGKDQVATAQKCREVDIEVKFLNYTTMGNPGQNYTVTLSRLGTGDPIGGVLITLFNTTDNTNSELIDFTEDMDALETRTMDFLNTTTVVYNANKIEMTAYFVNEAGEQELCSNTVTKEF